MNYKIIYCVAVCSGITACAPMQSVESNAQQDISKEIFFEVERATVEPVKVLTEPIRTGRVSWLYENGDRYEGYIKEDLKHGKGIYYFASGAKYNGEFYNDFFHGQGTFEFSDGRTYVGRFNHDEITGKGIITYPNGKKYRGEFINGKYDGWGVLSFGIDRTPIEGIWENGNFIKPFKEGWHLDPALSRLE